MSWFDQKDIDFYQKQIDNELEKSDIDLENENTQSDDDEGILGDDFLESDAENDENGSSRNEKGGWANVIQAVLHTKKPMLSRARLDMDVAIREKEEKEEAQVEVVDPATGQPLPQDPAVKKTKRTIRLLRKQAMKEREQKNLKKKKWDNMAHTEISEWDPEKERQKKSMATLAFIQFCKSVGKHQKQNAAKASVSRTADGKLKLTLMDDSEAFQENNKFLQNFDSSSKKQDTWNVLTDKYMLEENMEDDELEGEEQNIQDSVQPKKKPRRSRH